MYSLCLAVPRKDSIKHRKLGAAARRKVSPFLRRRRSAIHFALTHNNGSLFNNTFEGPIPDSIGQLSSAIALYLDKNELTGQIPTSIGKMTSLIDLW